MGIKFSKSIKNHVKWFIYDRVSNNQLIKSFFHLHLLQNTHNIFFFLNNSSFDKIIAFYDLNYFYF